MNFTNEIKVMYSKYSQDINRTREKMKSLINLPNVKAQLEDISAELTYLFLREKKPKTIVEVSPCGGWSSLWISQALIDNKIPFEYLSYDILLDSENTIPEEYKSVRKFVLGDCREQNFPDEIDYLFVDSEHSAPFAEWYIKTLFPKLSKGAIVSIHDMVNEVGDYWYKISNHYHQLEGREVVNYCELNNKDLWVVKHNYQEFKSIRKSVVEDYEILVDQDISSLAFISF